MEETRVLLIGLYAIVGAIFIGIREPLRRNIIRLYQIIPWPNVKLTEDCFVFLIQFIVYIGILALVFVSYYEVVKHGYFIHWGQPKGLGL